MGIELSIIVPVFNAEKTISSCLKSILTQNYQRFEVICINDGSSDDSLKVLEALARSDIRVVVLSKENGGMSSARNAGLDIARGRYIGFVDSDDYIEPEMFEALLELIKKDNVDFVGCGTNVIYRSWSDLRKRDENYFKINSIRGKELISGDFANLNVCVWNKVFKAELIQKYRIRFPIGLWYEDAAFVWCYLALSKTMSLTESKLYNYVRYETSIMGKTFSKSKRALDHISISHIVYDFFVENERINLYKKDIMNFMAQNILLTFYYLPWNQRKEAFLNSYKLFKKVGLWNSFSLVHKIVKKIYLKIIYKKKK